MRTDRTTTMRASLVMMLLCLLLASTQARGQAIAGYSEYILPGDELNMYYIFTNMDTMVASGCTATGGVLNTNMHSVTSVTAWSPNTTIYYDHWENGYNFDPANPGATADETWTLTNQGDVKVFESSNVNPGANPPSPRDPSTRCGGAMCYDGGDRIYVAGGQVTVTRAVWTECRGAGNQADAWEIYPVRPQLTTYVMPFGENLYANPTYFLGFQRVYALIQATADNTTVTVDLNNDGVPDILNQNRGATWNQAGPGTVTTYAASPAVLGNGATTFLTSVYPGQPIIINGIESVVASVTDNHNLTLRANYAGTPGAGQTYTAGEGATIYLNKGQSFLLDDISACTNHSNCTTLPDRGGTPNSGTLNAGAVITGNQTIQVKYVAGRYNQTYCARGISAFPRGFWSKEYYGPYGQAAAINKGVTDYYLFNPWTTPLTINYQTLTGSGTFSIPANSTESFNHMVGANPSVPQGSGVYFGSDREFWGVGFGDASNNRTGGGGNPSGQSYEWGFSLLPTNLLFREHFMGWSPGSLPLLTAPTNGNSVFLTVAQDNTRVFVDYTNDGVAEQTFTLSRLQSQFVAPNPATGDLQGARFWGTGDFTMAYGQNADTATTPTPNLDLGYVALPGADLVTLVLSVDKSTNPVVVPTTAPSTSVFTLVVKSQSYPVDNVMVLDNLAANWSYQNNSTTITLADLSTVSTNPTITNPGVNLPSPFTGACPTGRGPCLTWDYNVLHSMAANQQITITYTASNTGLAAGTLSENKVTAIGTRTVGSPPGNTQTFEATNFAYNVSGALGITKASNANTPAYPGDTFTYTTTVTNPASAGTNPQTSLSLFDPIPTGVSDVAGTTTLSRSTVGDSFNSQAYTLNVGTRNWSGNWVEANDTGGGATNGSATQGDIQITAGGELVLDNSNSREMTISRAVNLTGATTALLTFKYRTDTGVDAADHFYVQAGTAGTGGACATLATGDITNITGATSGTLSFDISAYIGANTTIRFTFPDGSYQQANEFFYVDDLSITYNVSVAGTNPPELLSASSLYALVGGQSLTATFNVTVNDPLRTGQTSVTNTASVTSAQLPIPIPASVTNILANPTPQAATVAGRVWLDGNANGAQDIGEPGIPNVQVTLKDQYGTPVATTLTDTNGRYLFTDVSPGTGYYVEATAPPNPAGAPLTNLTQSFPVGYSNYRTTTFDLAVGQNYTGADEGYKPAAGTVAFGDLVWVDPTNPGVRDAGEPGLGGVTLRLYRDAPTYDGALNPLNDTFVSVPTTGPGSVSVTNGNATVTGTNTKFTTLGVGDPIVIAGVSYTINAIGSDTSLTLNSTYTGATASGLSSTVLSTPGPGTVTTNTTGGVTTVTGTGTSFSSLLPGDPIEINGLNYKVATIANGTSLTLTTTAPNASNVIYGLATPTVSGPDGSYLFTGVTPASGTYFVTATTPAGYTSTTGTLYKFAGVTSGTAYLTADFGFNPATSYTITDRVWRDLNANGLYDNGETGIAGVTVALLDASSNVIATTTTDANGVFTFSGLAGNNADYTTKITDAAGVLTNYYGTTSYAVAGQRLEANLTRGFNRTVTGGTATATNGSTTVTGTGFNNLRNGDQITIDGVPYSIASVTNDTSLTLMAAYTGATGSHAWAPVPSYGYNATRAIGDTVYNDLNGNGTQGAGEPGMAGIVVSLYRDTNADGLIDLTTTTGPGTVQTFGTTAVTGTGTTFTNLHAGETITIAGVAYTIASIANNTHLTLATAAGTTASGQAYYAAPTGPGTVQTFGTTAVTGTGNNFLNYHAGEPIVINGAEYIIASVTDATHLTLTTTATAGSGLWYAGPAASPGTVSVTSGSAAVVGTGTTFTNYRPGQPITIDNGGTGVVYTIASITDATHLTLTATYAGATNGARTYYGPTGPLETAVTDSNGQYLFAGLANGSYIVSVPTPTSYTYVPGTRPDSDAGSPGIQLAATINGTANILDRDFGFWVPTAQQRTISGTIWNDASNYGVIDGSEAKIAGVTVDLLDSTGTTVLATTTTNSSGVYTFSGLPQNTTYTVKVTDTSGVLTGYSATYEKTGGTGGPFDGVETVVLATTDITDVNFGYKKPGPTYASLGSFAAFVSDRTVTVQWRTSSEIGTIGFNLLRWDPAAASFRQLNDRLLQGLIVHPEGGVYRFRDDDAPVEGPLTYSLVEVDVHGRQREHGPFTVVPSTQAAPETGSGQAEEAPWANDVVFQSRPNVIAKEQQVRLRLAMAEQLGTVEAAALITGGTVKITTNRHGLHYVSAGQIGAALGITSSAAAVLIAGGQVDLTSLGAEVAYLPTDGGSGFYFYADQPRTIYSTDTAYLLTAARGTTMGVAPVGTGGPHPTSFAATLHSEENHYALPVLFTNPETDFWCWDYVYAGAAGYDRKTFAMHVPAVAGTGAASLKIRLQGGSDTHHHAEIYWNGEQVAIGDPTLQWDGAISHDLTIPLDAAKVLKGDNTLELVGVLDPLVPYSIVYLDYFDLTYQRLYRAPSDEVTFTAPTSSTITVRGFSSSDILVLDLGSPTEQPSVVAAAISVANDGNFQAQFFTPAGGTPRSYLAVLRAKAKTPGGVAAIQLGGLKNPSNRADYVLIAPDSLKTATNSLATYRSGQGLETMVVALGDIYNEFNYGNASPYAIRAFLSYAVSTWNKAPRYATLVGRGTYDYKNFMGVGDCLVPPLMTATPYGLAVSDNRIADLSGDDGVPEIAFGRLPMLTSQDVANYLAKIQAHELASNPWQVLLAADNPDAAGSFWADSNAVGAIVPVPPYSVNTTVYLGQSPNEAAADARLAIINAINSGATVFNYIGHGGPGQLADEKIFQISDVQYLTNTTTMPIFIGMTCASGNYGFPGYPSLADLMLLKQGGGVFASWASSGLSEDADSVLLDEAFFTTTFVGGTKVVGDIVVSSLRSPSVAAVPPWLKNLYNLLGEPVSRLP